MCWRVHRTITGMGERRRGHVRAASEQDATQSRTESPPSGYTSATRVIDEPRIIDELRREVAGLKRENSYYSSEVCQLYVGSYSGMVAYIRVYWFIFVSISSYSCVLAC